MKTLTTLPTSDSPLEGMHDLQQYHLKCNLINNVEDNVVFLLEKGLLLITQLLHCSIVTFVEKPHEEKYFVKKKTKKTEISYSLLIRQSF